MAGVLILLTGMLRHKPTAAQQLAQITEINGKAGIQTQVHWLLKKPMGQPHFPQQKKNKNKQNNNMH